MEVKQQDIEWLWRMVQAKIGDGKPINIKPKGLIIFAFDEEHVATYTGGGFTSAGILHCIEFLLKIEQLAKSQISNENPLSI